MCNRITALYEGVPGMDSVLLRGANGKWRELSTLCVISLYWKHGVCVLQVLVLEIKKMGGYKCSCNFMNVDIVNADFFANPIKQTCIPTCK